MRGESAFPALALLQGTRQRAGPWPPASAGIESWGWKGQGGAMLLPGLGTAAGEVRALGAAPPWPVHGASEGASPGEVGARAGAG